MHHIVIAGKTFSVTQTGKKFLTEYRVRIESFLTENSMRESYLQDIETRLAEKLSAFDSKDTAIKDADVISIVNEIGEPEDIFSSVLKEEQQNMWGFQKKKRLQRNKRDAILFWVCAGIGDYFDVNPIWIRLFFLFLVFFGGTWILFYLFLAILLPVNKNTLPVYDGRPGFWEWIFSTTGTGIQRVFQALVFLILALLAFSIGCALFWFFVASSIFSAISIAAPFVVANQFFPVSTPVYLTFGLIVLTLSLLVLSVASFSLIFRKNFLGKTGWIALFLSATLSFILVLSGIISLIAQYSWSYAETDEKTFPYTWKSLEIVNLLERSDDKIQFVGNPEFFNNNNLSIVYQTGKTDITIRMKHVFHTKNDMTGKEIASKLIKPSITLSGSTLTLQNTTAVDFSDMVPYSFPERHTTIVLPAGLQITGDENIQSMLEEEKDFLEEEIQSLEDEVTRLKAERDAYQQWE